jgi:glycerol kinase
VPAEANRSANGTFPIVAWSVAGEITWGVEAVMLSAGSNIEWLRDDMGLIDSADDSHDVAAKCETTDGVVYVPALLGLGTPHWDFGARGTMLGLTRGSNRSHIVRPCSRASPTGGLTWWWPPRPTPATRSRRCASTAG